ncbi:arsenate reductase ArsC [Candidatus Calescamantes bacterium]|nr:arsenate reductase ArsC [Candidatus Calescamantes bacterium]
MKEANLKIAFVCIGNSCRSQMAEGFARAMYKESVEIFSAGTSPSKQVAVNAIEVMRQEGIDISEYSPKSLLEIPAMLDIVIKMGCEISCPELSGKIIEDWGIEDPWGGDLPKYSESRDLIRKKILQLGEKFQLLILNM